VFLCWNLKTAGLLQLRGVNIGGFLVLEPWITPSLFYQFLGQTEPKKVGMDTHSFCTALGSEEANKQLRRCVQRRWAPCTRNDCVIYVCRHWAAWVTEDHIKQLASYKINSLRIPVSVARDVKPTLTLSAPTAGRRLDVQSIRAFHQLYRRCIG
jgi:aryl-phospho-beta-D-glucosidase BglC (GH1 family)